jgi:hypothetical protein
MQVTEPLSFKTYNEFPSVPIDVRPKTVIPGTVKTFAVCEGNQTAFVRENTERKELYDCNRIGTDSRKTGLALYSHASRTHRMSPAKNPHLKPAVINSTRGNFRS